MGNDQEYQRIVAVALVTRDELSLLGPNFRRAYPVDQTPCFSELLRAIDEADRALWIERDRAESDRPLEVMPNPQR